MNKIIKSLSVIAFVAAIALAGTQSYFSDTETSTGNTFTAGTIDIDIDENNPFTGHYDIGDLKPGETGYMNFKIKNVGTNPANISKSLYNFTHTDSGEGYDCTASVSGVSNMTAYQTSSEPECVAEAGTQEDNVETQLIYDLSVEVYAGDDETNGPIWWQTIYKDSDGKTLTSVYGNTSTATSFVNLGMIPAGGHMNVTQSYHFNPNAGNEYQGDGLSFDMQIKADQLSQDEKGMATVTLVQKEKDGGQWHIKDGGASGTLTYKTKGPKFEYTFTATGLNAENYQLIYYPDPWASPKQIVRIGGVVSGSSITANGNVELGMDLPNPQSGYDDNYPQGAKIWLVPTSDLSNDILSWSHPEKYLMETALIQYDDTDL